MIEIVPALPQSHIPQATTTTGQPEQILSLRLPYITISTATLNLDWVNANPFFPSTLGLDSGRHTLHLHSLTTASVKLSPGINISAYSTFQVVYAQEGAADSSQ